MRRAYAIFIWHGFFLALTTAMLDLNTVFPALVASLVDSKAVFGLLYSIMLGVPFVFNIVFGHYLQDKPRKKPYLLLGIYLRTAAFLGMAIFTLLWAREHPLLLLLSLFGWVFLFSLSGGFASLAYADIMGKMVPKGPRGRLYATKQFASSLALLLGGLLVARLLALDGLPYPSNYAILLTIGGLGLFVAALAFWFIPEEKEEPWVEEKESLGQFIRKVPEIVRRDRAFLRFILAANLSSVSLMLLPFYILFAQDTFHLGPEWVGRFLVFQTLGVILSNLVWGLLSHRGGSRVVVRVCILTGGIIPLVALLLPALGPGAFGLVFVLVGFVMSGRKVGFEPYLLDLAPEDRRSIYVGINGTLNFSRVLLPALSGFLIDAMGFPVTFGMTVVVMALAYLLLGAPKEPAIPSGVTRNGQA